VLRHHRQQGARRERGEGGGKKERISRYEIGAVDKLVVGEKEGIAS
jgi:hypothetical protein